MHQAQLLSTRQSICTSWTSSWEARTPHTSPSSPQALPFSQTAAQAAAQPRPRARIQWGAHRARSCPSHFRSWSAACHQPSSTLSLWRASIAWSARLCSTLRPHWTVLDCSAGWLVECFHNYWDFSFFLFFKTGTVRVTFRVCTLKRKSRTHHGCLWAIFPFFFPFDSFSLVFLIFSLSWSSKR